ncbi:MAG: filamentous hemagglutinin N-terminal domain-containing protein, partial [Holosporales bacterium]
MANPEGGVVVGGAASIAAQGNTTTITQTSDRAAINWNSFDIKAGETTEFKQPNQNSVALNRVIGSEQKASQIAGNLIANGKVILINPNGILFDKSAKVDVAGLVASTANMRDADFMAGSGAFNEASSNKTARVVNKGTITLKESGLGVLVAPDVANEGTITAKLGRVALGGAETTTIDFYGNGMVQFAVQDAALATAVANNGAIINEGGSITMTAKAASDLLDSVVTNTGSLTAKNGGSVAINAARTTLDSGSSINVDGAKDGGTVAITTKTGSFNGTISAQGSAGKGGTVQITATKQVEATAGHSVDVSGKTGGRIKQEAAGTFSSATYRATGTAGAGGVIEIGGNIGFLGATLDASGTTAGGRVNVGGNWQGGKDAPANERLQTAGRTLVSQGSTLKASTTGTTGPGGEVVVWADDKTDFYGSIDVRGGSQSGSGGRAEVSGGALTLNSQDIQTGHPDRQGSLLIDPKNLTISDNAPQGLGIIKLAHNYAGYAPGLTLADFDYFGVSVALNATGDMLAVGAYRDDTGGLDRGAVYLFNLNTANLDAAPTYRYKLASGSPGLTLANSDHFGVSVALNGAGDMLAVGALYDDTGGMDRGAVYLFNLNPANLAAAPTYRYKLAHGSAGLTLANFDIFGGSVALNASGDMLAVGAFHDYTGGLVRGAAYLFNLNPANLAAAPTYRYKLAHGSAGLTLADGDAFGSSVALNGSGDMLAVGSLYDDTGGLD